jgi:sensor domain CHASE-containing protein
LIKTIQQLFGGKGKKADITARVNQIKAQIETQLLITIKKNYKSV